ncbi:MAG TPA: hypothetical protein VG869_03855 [Acidimicrobiia bacterium]|nr:hypothetical protein [Acidimicrobiia bacterium]HEV3450318.1 hypothetical protein [Acidimicrobiia bacterium]
MFLRSLSEGLERSKQVTRRDASLVPEASEEILDKLILVAVGPERTFMALAHGAERIPGRDILLRDDGSLMEDIRNRARMRAVDNWEATAIRLIKACRRADPQPFEGWAPYRRLLPEVDGEAAARVAAAILGLPPHPSSNR